ncbi:porin family protein [Pedobacter namyangjuensis]|uniref:hypothetical protein n=1 Tax=Pedobacter namyangjuensis TaxID=600626 RepID=UPI000DE2A777|nr:hypothetical protein [Pedobacter namyangjuensis]
MKPTEPNKPLDNELIAHIRESLVAHEEEYLSGAWEKFNNKPTPKTPIIWLNAVNILRGVAALLVLGFLGYFLIDKKEGIQSQNQVAKANPEQPVQKPVTQTLGKPGEDTEASSSVLADTENDKSVNLGEQQSRSVVGKDILEKDFGLALNPTNVDKGSGEQTITANRAEQKTVSVAPKEVAENVTQQIIAKNKPDETKPNIIEFFDSETKKNQTDKNAMANNKTASKFTVGVVVAPSFGNVNKLNMGYGVSVDYSLSDKFSLNSGIAYNQMAAAKGAFSASDGAMNAPSSSAIIQRQSTRSLTSVQEQISGIDIPLELKYHINKNLYANVGVSAFAVISQKTDNTYLENRVEQRVSNSASGFQQLSSVLVTDKVTEQAEPSTVDNYSYLGFYNFSFGYKKKISKNNAFAVEPFVKLPMREVNTQNLRLIGTGVKLKFDF